MNEGIHLAGIEVRNEWEKHWIPGLQKCNDKVRKILIVRLSGVKLNHVNLPFPSERVACHSAL